MGQLHDNRLKPLPAWYYCATDLFDTMNIKDAVKRRTVGKCFGVVFTCLTTRAVHVELAENYSTAAFLGALRRFASLRGYPFSIHSDNGTQLIAANKELIALCKLIETEKLCEFAQKHKIEWSFNRSSDAPWQNGACESLIKSVKVSLQKAIGDSVLTFAELQTVLYEAANLVNSRPIGVKLGYDVSLGFYLCPNDLLLGRNDRHAPYGCYNPASDPKARFTFIQTLIDNFWRRWQRDYFPTLLVQQKWHSERRNLCVRDIVLVQDANALRGNWRMG